jgi:hypothetical protein
MQLQFDPAGTAPLKDATDWCNQYNDTTVTISGVTETVAGLLPACLAGVKAAGGP